MPLKKENVCALLLLLINNNRVYIQKPFVNGNSRKYSYLVKSFLQKYRLIEGNHFSFGSNYTYVTVPDQSVSHREGPGPNPGKEGIQLHLF